MRWYFSVPWFELALGGEAVMSADRDTTGLSRKFISLEGGIAPAAVELGREALALFTVD
jgi:hypothetical protein